MITGQSAHATDRSSVESPGNASGRGIARDPRAKSIAAALAAACAVAASPFAMGCAEEAEREPERAVEPKPAAQPPRAQAPSEDAPPGGPEYRFQRKVDWWTHALEVLFDGIDLTEEQKSGVDAILEAQLGARLRMQEFDLALSNARRRHDTEGIDAAREEFRKARAQIKEPHEIYEEMRALLDEAQHPAFDMNRARHVAEMQGSAGMRPDERAEQSGYE